MESGCRWNMQGVIRSKNGGTELHADLVLPGLYKDRNSRKDHIPMTTTMSGLKQHPLWQIFPMSVMIVCVLIAAGCTAPSSTPAATTSSNVTATLPLALCPPAGEPEITIDPIANHSLGDTISISGTTNLKPGELLNVWIILANFDPCGKCPEIANDSVEPRCCSTGIERQVDVMPGMCGMNTWRLAIDTSRHGFSPGVSYLVEVSGRNESVLNASLFTLVE